MSVASLMKGFPAHPKRERRYGDICIGTFGIVLMWIAYRGSDYGGEYGDVVVLANPHLAEPSQWNEPGEIDYHVPGDHMGWRWERPE